MASSVSDIVSNIFRVIKTVKQTTALASDVTGGGGMKIKQQLASSSLLLSKGTGTINKIKMKQQDNNNYKYNAKLPTVPMDSLYSNSRHNNLYTTLNTTTTSTTTNSYTNIIGKIIHESGLIGLFTRGLLARLISNGLQSILFTILWKEISAYLSSSSSSSAAAAAVVASSSNSSAIANNNISNSNQE